MAAFGMMALFTREANAPVLTVAAWRAILVAAAFGVWAYPRGTKAGIIQAAVLEQLFAGVYKRIEGFWPCRQRLEERLCRTIVV